MDHDLLTAEITDFIREHTFDRSARVTSQQTYTCLQAFLPILDAVNAHIEGIKEDPENNSPIIPYLIQMGWLNACELMIDCFNHTRRDEQYDAIVRYMVEGDALTKVRRLLAVIKPEARTGMDSIRLVSTLRDIFIQWGGEVNRPKPKPLLFIFDNEMLGKVLSGEKTCLRTVTQDWDGARKSGGTYLSLHRGESFRNNRVYERGKTYPIWYEEGNDDPVAHIRMTGLDKAYLQESISWRGVNEEGFSSLEEFVAWWDARHDEGEKWVDNPKIWSIWFRPVDEGT